MEFSYNIQNEFENLLCLNEHTNFFVLGKDVFAPYKKNSYKLLEFATYVLSHMTAYNKTVPLTDLSRDLLNHKHIYFIKV